MTGHVGIVDATGQGGLGAAVTSGNALKVDPSSATAPAPIVASWTDRGGTITTGGTSQTLMAANATRKGFEVHNPLTATGQGIAAAESLFINFTSAANAANSTSIEIQPGGMYSEDGDIVTGELITIVGATTNHKFVAKER